MSIVDNIACPKCQEQGRDKTSNHLLVFADGGMYCNKAEYHADGKVYYVAGNGEYIKTILESEIDGTTKYTPEVFRELHKAGKLNDPSVRALAMAGMSTKNRWEVADSYERDAMLTFVEYDKEYFEQLKIRNLVSRGIRGEVAKRFDVRVGVDSDNKVCSHYYPVHSLDLSWRGAKCRTLPKDFSRDSLGFTWGDTALFGMKPSMDDFAAGHRKWKLLLVGGECDAMAAWQMLSDSDTGGTRAYHVWSPTHGENAMQDILNNKEEIDKFSEIVLAFDNDSVGRQMNMKISRLFRGKCKFLVYPKGTKDANQCLLEGRNAEFVDAWFNPAENYGESEVKTVDDLYELALETPEMGKSWFAKELNKMTIGIRMNMLFTICAGSGVGKTAFTKQVCFDLMENHKQTVGVIYLEEPCIKTLRSYASYYSTNNKRFDLPPNNPDEPESYLPELDYTMEEATEALNKLRELNLLHIADLKGDKSIDRVMKAIDDMVAMGIKYIVVDNLTAITHPKAGNKVDSIDETMKAIGTYKDENECSIFLISHLKKVNENSGRTPHNYGGEVWETDLRGSGTIVMWSNYTIAIERNCFADTEHEKRITTVRCLKDRDFGMFTGYTAKLFGQKTDGRMVSYATANYDLGNGETAPQLACDGFTEY